MPLKRRQWSNLLQALSNQSCVLLLGPGVLTVEGGKLSLNEKLAEKLTVDLKEADIDFDNGNKHNLTYIMQRFLTIDDVIPNDPGFEAKLFFEKNAQQPNTILNNLASLPFNLVVNTSPDDLMIKAFKNNRKYKTVHRHYNHRKEINSDDEFETPSTEAPLVFNLFGYYKKPESLVLTESDQIAFVSNVVKDNPPLPPKILRQFDNLKTYLFLGFDWEEWHMRLLLNSLNLSKESMIISSSPERYKVTTSTKEFYQSSFRFEFINENLDSFVQLLKERFNEFQEENPSNKQIVIAASEEDETYRDQLATHLAPLKNKAPCWHEGMVSAGDEVTIVKKQFWDKADIILLLISAKMLDSDELNLVLQKQKEDKVKVIPIILKSCDWESIPELTMMSLILPQDGSDIGKAINKWDQVEDAYQNVVSKIKEFL